MTSQAYTKTETYIPIYKHFLKSYLNDLGREPNFDELNHLKDLAHKNTVRVVKTSKAPDEPKFKKRRIGRGKNLEPLTRKRSPIPFILKWVAFFAIIGYLIYIL